MNDETLCPNPIVGAVGGLAGFIIGSARIAIPINGDMAYYNYNKDRLRNYSIQH